MAIVWRSPVIIPGLAIKPCGAMDGQVDTDREMVLNPAFLNVLYRDLQTLGMVDLREPQKSIRIV